VQSNLPVERTQKQVKSLRDTIFCRLITEALQNYAQNFDACDTEGRVRLGYNYQTFVFGEVTCLFFLRTLGTAEITVPGR
jgi:hypothetical protein